MSSLEALDDPRAAARRREEKSSSKDRSSSPRRSESTRDTVFDGPRWYRTRIRSRGPFAAVIPPLLVGLVALALVNVGDSTLTGAAGLVGGSWAAPVLLFVGAPLADSSTYPVAVAGSTVLWLAIGFVTARRATRHPMADWGDFWRHYFWSAVGVLVGVCAALATVGWVFGKSLL